MIDPVFVLARTLALFRSGKEGLESGHFVALQEQLKWVWMTR
ncbi:MAG: hypothetical protein ACJARL_002519 [Halopseudomonas sp.]|jgi:hypothetical protein